MEKGGRGDDNQAGRGASTAPRRHHLRLQTPDLVDTVALAPTSLFVVSTPVPDERNTQITVTASKVSTATLKQSHRHTRQSKFLSQLTH